MIIVGDPHFESFEKDGRKFEFFEKEILPYSEKGEELIILGDMFTSKRKADFSSLIRFMDFLKRYTESGAKVHILVGNHDRYFAGKDERSNCSVYGYVEGVKVYEEPALAEIEGIRCAFVPFGYGAKDVPDGAEVVFAHGEVLPHYPKAKERIEDYGKAELFFGHYHKRVEGIYVGTPYSLDMSDLDEKKGYYRFSKRDGVFVRNFLPNPYDGIFLSVEAAPPERLESRFLEFEGNGTDAIGELIEKLKGKRIGRVRIRTPEGMMTSEFLVELTEKMENSGIGIPFEIEFVGAAGDVADEDDSYDTPEFADVIREMIPESAVEVFEELIARTGVEDEKG